MIRALDQAWRTIATAISFALFGLGGVALACTVFPFLNIFIRDKEERARVAQHTVHVVWRVYVEAMRLLGVVSLEVHGAEVLRQERGAIVIANHPSLLDVVFIMSLMEHTQCVISKSVWDNPFMRGVVSAANYIPNSNDPAQLVLDCAKALKAGNNLMIFPEGSRTRPGQKRVYQRGFAYIALESGAPVRLVTMECNPATLLKGEPWYKVPSRRAHWIIRVHERIDVAEHFGQQQPALAARSLCAHVERRIEESLAR